MNTKVCHQHFTKKNPGQNENYIIAPWILVGGASPEEIEVNLMLPRRLMNLVCGVDDAAPVWRPPNLLRAPSPRIEPTMCGVDPGGLPGSHHLQGPPMWRLRATSPKKMVKIRWRLVLRLMDVKEGDFSLKTVGRPFVLMPWLEMIFVGGENHCI